MTIRVYYTLILIGSLVLVGCRQADGPLPLATEEASNRVTDISRDLLAVAAGSESAVADLVDDLIVFAFDENDETVTASTGLARSLVEALQGTQLSEEQSAQLAYNVWLVMVATEFSQNQMIQIRDELLADLLAVGAIMENTEAVAVQVNEVQQHVSTRSRRWYEVF
jgi:hypothetical protein